LRRSRRVNSDAEAPFGCRRRSCSFRSANAAGATLNLGALGRAFAAADLTVGIVYVGARDDFGWNQAHAVAIKSLKEAPGVKVVEEENVPETDAVSKSMESMINLDGAGLILATSFGYYKPFVLDLSKRYPDVQFRHAAPLWRKDTDPKNAGSYFGYLNQAHYVNGVAAGLCTKSNKIGFVAAKPIASVLSNINSALLGARSVNPNATVRVIFTGDWSMPVREAESANALVDAGCDVITCHVDGPKVVIETAEKRGVMSCGHNASQAPLAPASSLARNTSGSRSTRATPAISRRARRCRAFSPAATRSTSSRIRLSAPGRSPRRKRRRWRRSRAFGRKSRSMSDRSRTTRPARS
jgi:simple sugar transport system substrate-binding protein